jgi:hypothetical protein
VSPLLGDQFTAVKWYVLELLAIAWALVEVARRRPAPSSGFLRRRAAALIALAGLTLVGSLRPGLGWAAEPILARGAFVALFFCFHAHFRRRGNDTRAIRAALGIGLAIVTALGLAQAFGSTRALGLEPLFGLTSGDGRSATFGNANMAAQFVGFAVAVLVAGRVVRARPESRSIAVAHDTLIVAGLGYVVIAGGRSAMLAVAAAFVVVATLAGVRGRRVVLRPVIAAALLALPVAAIGALDHEGSPGLLAGIEHPLKKESLRLRARLWQRTVELIRDRPLGAGSGNFLHAFLPYQLRDERLRSEAVVYSSPHSEPLRALAEEGVVWCALAAWLLAGLAAAVARRARAERWPPTAVVLAAGGAFLAVESVFQFPFGMAFGCLAAAALLGLAVSWVDGGGAAATPLRTRASVVRLLALAGLLLAAAALGRLVASDYLAATAGPRGRWTHRACALNPRHVRACLASAWLEARAGRRQRARLRLAAILDRSPYYYPAIELLAEESLAQGDARAGCFHLWIYDRLFDGRSSQHERLAARCDPSLLETFARNVRVPGYERFPLAVPAGAR